MVLIEQNGGGADIGSLSPKAHCLQACAQAHRKYFIYHPHRWMCLKR